MISQPKIDLAVLLALFNHSETGGDSQTPEELVRLLEGKFSTRRIKVALDELRSRNEVVREYNPHYEEGFWEISREGIVTVEKALRIPSSFIARLNANGLEWLETDEADKAVLSKLQRYLDDKPVLEDPKSIPAQTGNLPNISVNVSPTFTNEVNTNASELSSSDQATWFGSWGTWVGAAAAIAAIFVSLYLAGKL